ncbi:hypothetical protein BKA08_000381 [Nocardioides marinisabuli]|uniref:DUF222 domain-containing protein n=1 Tax=Nocardioides marinisabuli TaxID=419476 RepID=A0A7Y9EY80_9ACTN|nr:HNH endonuclease signature motif containing protein [Nocardioides marinisabuli]NYD56143.1 hypothetical protein [Nocardioides marinisabuli]
MSSAAPVSDLVEEQILARAAACAEDQRRAGVELLVLAYEWAIAHPKQRLSSREAGRPGREQARAYGGDGTPEVTEFAAATFGAAIGRTTYAGRRLMAAALDLRLRLPLLWSRVQALEVRDSYAIHVADKTRHLSKAEAAWVDGEVAEAADGRLPWSRFAALVEGKVAAAAPALAREAEERRAKARFAKRIGTSENGMASFLIRAPLPVIEALDGAVTELARRLRATQPDPVSETEPDETGDDADSSGGVDDLRVHAVALLADPAAAARAGEAGVDLRDLMPDVTLFVHLHGGGPAAGGRDINAEGEELDRVARVEGHGPVTESWLRGVLGRFARFVVRPVIDLAEQSPVDAYEVPARHRRAVQLMTPADCFPWGACTSRTMQTDHTDPHARGGPSQVGNYGPLTPTHHRVKTHGDWQVRQPFPGIYLWRDAHDHTYLVDHTGTRTLTPPGPPPAPPSRPRSTFEIYQPDWTLDIDYAA